jgi:hypothetical protein
MMKKSLFLMALPVSLVIILIACIGLRRELKKMRVANNGIQVETKINNLYIEKYRRATVNYYADFVGKGVHMKRMVSDEFYYTHRINDEVTMKYLPDEDIIMYGYETAGGTFILRVIFAIFAIVILVFAGGLDILIRRKTIRKKQQAAKRK